MSKVTETAPPSHCPSERFSDALALRQDPHACADLLHNQLDVSFYDDLALFVGLSTKKLFSLLDVSPAVQRRWKKVQQLTISESDYAFQQALVIQDALGLFEGNRVATVDWLTQPNTALGRTTPASLLSTFVGMSTVESLIWKIGNGVYL
jgi:putative toxin-antitoxin system antitoxin component (TIGR02293 family)